MVLAYLVILIFIIVAVVQVPGFIKHKEYKEMGLYLFIMFFALLYAISGVTDWDFPDPTDAVDKIFDPISRLIFPDHLM